MLFLRTKAWYVWAGGNYGGGGGGGGGGVGGRVEGVLGNDSTSPAIMQLSNKTMINREGFGARELPRAPAKTAFTLSTNESVPVP